MQRILWALPAIWLWISPVEAAGAAYLLDRQHTAVIFSWERAGLSRQQGRFADVNGTLEFDPAKPEESRLDVAIRASSLQTGVDVLDRHLRSADFFDIANHPIITFRSTEVRRTGERNGEVTGELTILGTTKPVSLKVDWIFAGPHPLGAINPALNGRPVVVFSARGVLKRSDWGLDRGVPLVSDEIHITINTEAIGR